MAISRPSGILNQVRDKAASQLNEQKTRATDSLGSVAQAVRQSTHHLREQQYDTVAQFVERAADQIERFSNHLRERDLNDLVSEAQRFARQQPAVFIGSSFAAGMLAARFIKASRPTRSFDDRGYSRVRRHRASTVTPRLAAARTGRTPRLAGAPGSVERTLRSIATRPSAPRRTGLGMSRAGESCNGTAEGRQVARRAVQRALA